MATSGPCDLDRSRLEEAAARIATDVGLELVVLFGSAARQVGARAKGLRPGDVDLGYVGGASAEPVDLTNRFIRELALQEVDVVDLRRADPVLLLAVARDGEPLYQADPTRFARFQSLAARRFADTRKFRSAEREEIRQFLSRRMHPDGREER
ncbi:MAG TPA: nucleotidyltransferase domain-containing protein [Gemmatimonadota bacterium]|nr:nucleotidyltransferase domain-containing protein [Gemmatimonadota bacterium]